MMNLGLDEPKVADGSSFADTLRAILARAKTDEGLVVTGIGSRETPDDILKLMTRIGRRIEELGGILRSGGAGGADLAFEAGWRNAAACEIFHPWHGFKPKIGSKEIDVTRALGRKRPIQGVGSPIVISGETLEQAEEIAAATHPAWEKCGQGARKLHTRNIPQILGASLNRVTDLVICWTVDGRASGGTGQAMRLAQRKGAQIVNLKRAEDRQAILEALGLED